MLVYMWNSKRGLYYVYKMESERIIFLDKNGNQIEQPSYSIMWEHINEEQIPKLIKDKVEELI